MSHFQNEFIRPSSTAVLKDDPSFTWTSMTSKHPVGRDGGADSVIFSFDFNYDTRTQKINK